MKRLLLAVGITGVVGAAACSDTSTPTRVTARPLAPSLTLATGSNTIVVRESDISRRDIADPPATTTAWTLFTRGLGTGAFVAGPGTPPVGFGSFQTSTSDGTAKATLFNYEHIGTALSAITAISYGAFVSSPGSSATQAPSLNVQIDRDGGAFVSGDFATLVFEPVYNTGQGAVVTGAWQSWDAYDGGQGVWWSTRAIPGVCAFNCFVTWSTILANNPSATILGGVGVNQGGGNAGLVGAVDALTLAYGGNSVTYDFEDSACYFSDAGTTRTLLGDCETSSTILVPGGWTLDGDGYTITAVDPAGGHFLGAVVANGGASANVIDLGVTARNLADVCDAGSGRLRGILLEGASGTVSGNRVFGVRQGASGCQEGTSIEVRNAPYAAGGPDLFVAILHNVVSDYQKGGIVANGSVAATITGNSVTGDGPIAYTAQNGIQVAFGATAVVRGNTVSGNDYTPASYVACGLLIYQADGVKASANTLFANERDMCNYGKGGGTFKPDN